MANTYTKIYLHIVFAVKRRFAFLPAPIRPRIFAYICGILKECGHLPISIGGVDDHVHILFAYNVNQTVPDLVKLIKTSVTSFVNENHFIPFKFSWQRGYAAFSYSHSHVDEVMRYIERQPEHHKGITLNQEIELELQRRGVEYDPKYLFEE